jgi:hypothetical protein
LRVLPKNSERTAFGNKNTPLARDALMEPDAPESAKLLGLRAPAAYAGRWRLVFCAPRLTRSKFAKVTKMIRKNWLVMPGIVLIVTVSARVAVTANASSGRSSKEATGPAVEFFAAMEEGQVDVKFIAKSDRAARVLITNKTKQPLRLQLPEAFAGVPVLAQLGGGGFGGGGRGGGGLGGGGGGQQSVGGGLGGGGGGQIGGGGGGGFFNIPPQVTAKLNVPVVCLDHGLRNPSSSRPYKIVPATEHLDRPAVIELLKAFGRGELDRGATQAAAWHLNNDLSWNELATKRQGTRRSVSRPPYFSRQEIQAGMAYASEATRLGEANAEEYERERESRREQAKDAESSELRSTTDTDSIEPK